MNRSSSRPTGTVVFDIELLDAMAATMDAKLEIIDSDFDGILGNLAAGTCDVVPGRRPRGPAVLDLIDTYRVRGGVTMASGSVARTSDLIARVGRGVADLAQTGADNVGVGHDDREVEQVLSVRHDGSEPRVLDPDPAEGLDPGNEDR